MITTFTPRTPDASAVLKAHWLLPDADASKLMAQEPPPVGGVTVALALAEPELAVALTGAVTGPRGRAALWAPPQLAVSELLPILTPICHP